VVLLILLFFVSLVVDVYWEVQEQQISSVRKTKNKDNRTVYFYKLTALEPDTSGRL
jgi:hypothetical protein